MSMIFATVPSDFFSLTLKWTLGNLQSSNHGHLMEASQWWTQVSQTQDETISANNLKIKRRNAVSQIHVLLKQITKWRKLAEDYCYKVSKVWKLLITPQACEKCSNCDNLWKCSECESRCQTKWHLQFGVKIVKWNSELYFTLQCNDTWLEVCQISLWCVNTWVQERLHTMGPLFNVEVSLTIHQWGVSKTVTIDGHNGVVLWVLACVINGWGYSLTHHWVQVWNCDLQCWRLQ